MKLHMTKKNILLLFNHFEQEHLGKDVFLAPYYLALKNDAQLTIVYKQTKTNKNFPKKYKGVFLKPISADTGIGRLNNPYWIFKSLLYLLWNSKRFDVLICFHLFFRTFLHTCLYKMLNSEGRIYVKLDIPDFIINKIKEREKSIFWNKCYHKCAKVVDYFSVETSSSFDLMRNLAIFKKYSDKFIFMPNGFDSLGAEELKISPLPFEEKENIMITVGRIGTQQKNTQMFLKALAKFTPQKKWKIFFVGPVEQNFMCEIKEFYAKNPETEKYVFFLGSITDKTKLWSLYAKSKVFVLTSTWESYGLVLNEARYFKNFIISTDVGAAKDITEGKYGCIIGNSHLDLLKTLEEIDTGVLDINVYNNDSDNESITWKTMIQRIPLKI